MASSQLCTLTTGWLLHPSPALQQHCPSSREKLPVIPVCVSEAIRQNEIQLSYFNCNVKETWSHSASTTSHQGGVHGGRQQRAIVARARRSDDGAAFRSTSEDSSRGGAAEEFDQEKLLEDLERLRKKQELDSLRVPLSVQKRREEEEKERAKGNVLKDTLEKILVADFFFICACLVWFLTGVGQQSIFRSSTVLDAFIPFWDPIVQPALGLFMAGALASGAVGYLNRNKD